jgi:hypothetical protein
VTSEKCLKVHPQVLPIAKMRAQGREGGVMKGIAIFLLLGAAAMAQTQIVPQRVLTPIDGIIDVSRI